MENNRFISILWSDLFVYSTTIFSRKAEKLLAVLVVCMEYGLSSINSCEIGLLNYSAIYSSLSGDVRNQASLKISVTFGGGRGGGHNLSLFHLQNRITGLHTILVVKAY